MTIKLISLLLLFFFVFLLFGKVDAIIFQTRQGEIEGYTVRINGIETNVFKAIPFAKPPVGTLRFQRPQKPDKWPGIRNGTQYAPACMTNATVTKSVQNRTSEDCLYLNIFVDSRCTEKDPCPVVVIIHGGAFQGDSASMFNETHLLSKYASDRIILVLTTYRLGIFGLLDLGQELDTEPYNIAVYDIIRGLEWLHDELPAFGGNTSMITLFGYSSSGATLLTLLASPVIPEHLFQRVFTSSGCPRLHPHFSRSMSLAVLDYVKCNTTSDLRSQIQCLRSKPAKSLSNAMRATVDKKWRQVGVQSDSYFYPSPTLPKLRSNWKPKPLMLMASANELKELEAQPLPHICMHYLYIFGYSREETLAACVQHYTQINETETSPFYHDVEHTLARDVQHASSVMIASWNVQSGQPAYVGLMDQKKHNSHVGDLYYLIGFHYNEHNRTVEDDLMESFYVNSFKRFVKGQAPLEDWPSSDDAGKGYYYFNFANVNKTSKLNMSESIRPQYRENEVYNPEAVDFWLNHERGIEEHTFKESNTSQNGTNTGRKGANFVQANKNEQLSISAQRPELFKLQYSRLRPLHNKFLVFIAVAASAAALIVILMLLDAFRSGRLLRRYRDEDAVEANEDTMLLVVSRERTYTEI